MGKVKFQLLGVVTYNCDSEFSNLVKTSMWFQLLGVVTYNCDLDVGLFLI